MPAYNLYCPNCDARIDDFWHSIKDEHPPCTECGTKMETYFPGMTVAFKGFTTPGGNGRPANIRHKMPSELKKWYDTRMDMDRYTASEASKPVTWPDGTVHKGVKESQVSQDNLT